MPEMNYVDSSNIEAIGYEPGARELHVTFIESGTYVYYDVDEWVFHEFMNADSKGRYHWEHVRDRYEYQKL